MPEESRIIPVKSGVVAKPAPSKGRRGLFSLMDHFLSHKQSLFHDVFFRGLVKLLLKQAKQVTFADEKMAGDLLNPRDCTEMVIGIFQGLGNQGGKFGGAWRKGLRKEAYMIKQLRKQMREDLFKGVTVAVLAVEIAFAKNVLDDAVAREVNDLHMLGDPGSAFHTVLLYVKEDIISLVSGGRVYLDKVILQGADEDKIAFFQFVFSVLYDVGSVTVHKVDQLIGVVCMH